jgi:hypothetical protein
MGHITYFLPGATETMPATGIVSSGLAHALDPARHARRTTQRGPNGGPGLLLASDGIPDCSPAMVWHQPAEGDPAWWCGWDPAKPPTAQDLARPEQFTGHPVILAGEPWTIPVARFAAGGTPFPRRLTRQAGAFVAGEVEAQFRSLWDAACRIWDAICGSADSIEIADAAAIACQALACNYRISETEIDHLGLLNTANILAICKALADWPAVMEIAEKKAPEPSSPLPGGPA